MDTSIDPSLRNFGALASALLASACSAPQELSSALAQIGQAPAQRETASARDPAAAPFLGAPVAEAASARDEAALLDPWSRNAREDGAKCREELTRAGFSFRALADKAQPDASGCGIAHPVVVTRGPTGIRYTPAVTIDCSMARALGSVERIVQEEAEAHLGARIVKIGNLGAYACRTRNNRKGAALSAHAFGSAVDVSSFHPAKGTAAIIARDYAEPKRPSPASDARRRFLREVFTRLRGEADLTYVVGPDFNRAHHDHFHLDRGGWHFWLSR